MKNKNIPLLVGILMPIIFIIIIAVIIFAPSLSIKPQYDFIYAMDDNISLGQFRNTYTVENGVIVVQEMPLNNNQTYRGGSPILYRYDIKNNTAKQLTFEQASTLNLDAGPSSPDGYTVKYEYGHNGIFELFGDDSNDNGFYIEKGNGRKLLSGLGGTNRYYYPNNFKLIGWIK